MKVSLECVVIYSDNFFVDIELPDDIRFYEFFRHNDKQRFYVTICRNGDLLYNELSKRMAGRCSRYVFGEYMVLEIRQCHPVNEDLPLMRLDDLNNLFDEHIKGYYIKSERPSRKHIDESQRDAVVEIAEDGMVDITNLYRAFTNDYYTEYIAKPLGFVTRTGEDLSMEFAVIRMYSWLGDGFHEHVHRFEIDIKEMSVFDGDSMHRQRMTVSNSAEMENEYRNEIRKLLDMDNYGHIDYRESA